jgi:hypothetical protein
MISAEFSANLPVHQNNVNTQIFQEFSGVFFGKNQPFSSTIR